MLFGPNALLCGALDESGAASDVSSWTTSVGLWFPPLE